jgi:hypothetical protein
MNSATYLAALASWAFSGMALGRLTAPAAKASPSGVAALARALALGRSRRKNSVLFSTKGAWKGSE